MSGVAFTFCAMPGILRGTATSEASEYAPTPAMFFAATLKVCATPVFKPVTVAETVLPSPSSNTTQVVAVHD